MTALRDVYGDLLIVRPPVPATCNKAGANYKSEVAHLEYSPRRAYDEWLSILDAITACGGDAIYQFEPADDRYLGHAALEVDGDGAIRPAGSREVLGNMADVMTGRVFAANGPWVTCDGKTLAAVMPNMLDHRRPEAAYYRALLGELASAGGLALEVADNPHRWEGMADVAAVGDRVVLTYAVPGHYDRGIEPKSSRSSYDGVAFAADRAGVAADARIYAELVYPHFHGDTVHFGARPTNGPPVLVHYAAGLYDGYAERVAAALPDRPDRTRRCGRAIRREFAPGPSGRARARRRIGRVRRRRSNGSGSRSIACRCSSCSARRVAARRARRCICRGASTSRPTSRSATPRAAIRCEPVASGSPLRYESIARSSRASTAAEPDRRRESRQTPRHGATDRTSRCNGTIAVRDKLPQELEIRSASG